MIRIHKYILATCMSLCLYGCVQIPQPDLYADPDAIHDVSTAKAFLSSVYASFPHYEYELSLLGNDFCPTNLATKDVETLNLYRWQDKQLTKLSEDLWEDYYHTIAQCDVFLERLTNLYHTSVADSTQLNMMQGEALMIKSMAYFDLIKLYSPSAQANSKALSVVFKDKFGLSHPHRIPSDSALQIVSHWVDRAYALLPNNVERNGWFHKEAARYMMAEIALQARNYTEAADYAMKIWQQRPTVSNEWEMLWADNSNASRIFGWYLDQEFYTTLQYSEADGDYYAISSECKLTETDKRQYYVYARTMDGQTRTLLGKYNRNNKTGHNNRYIATMRYAGALFIAAEALAHVGKEHEALSMVNDYLAECNAPLLDTSLTKETAIQAILQEKAKEFCGEGKNYFDKKRSETRTLSRWGTWGNALPHSTIISDSYKWALPIPKSEYQYNSNITQNEGWQNSSENTTTNENNDL